MSNQVRRMFASGLIELANLQAVALVFGQFISERIDVAMMVLGASVAVVFYMAAYLLANVNDDDD